jgi:hypothetical protein
LVDGGAVVSARELTGARAAMAAQFSAWRESEEGGRNGGSSRVPWRLEGRRGLTSGAAVGVRPPQCVHAAAMA